MSPPLESVLNSPKVSAWTCRHGPHSCMCTHPCTCFSCNCLSICVDSLWAQRCQVLCIWLESSLPWKLQELACFQQSTHLAQLQHISPQLRPFQAWKLLHDVLPRQPGTWHFYSQLHDGITSLLVCMACWCDSVYHSAKTPNVHEDRPPPCSV